MMISLPSCLLLNLLIPCSIAAFLPSSSLGNSLGLVGPAATTTTTATAVSAAFSIPSLSRTHEKNNSPWISSTIITTSRQRQSQLYATVEETSSSSSSSITDSFMKETIENTKSKIVNQISKSTNEGQQWAIDFDLQNERGAAFYSLFAGIRSMDLTVMGMNGVPFYLSQNDISVALKDIDCNTPDDADNNNNNNNDDNGVNNLQQTFQNYFTFQNLAKALQDDFLDATRGSTNNRKGWAVTAVSTPTGSSFEEARMTLEQVQSSLNQGTVIFNTAGSHISSLAIPTLACTDASALPCAVNLYVTQAGKRTSAPPHTDRQDVIVIQTCGKKHWKVYTPPISSNKPWAEPFARGKGEDSLSYYSLEESAVGCTKVLDVVLQSGDVLFIPAGFPHTTDTVNGSNSNGSNSNDSEDDKDGSANDDTAETSLHLTFNFDTHVWDLDYLSVRRLALRRAGVHDSALEQTQDTDNKYVGNVNLLPPELRNDLLTHLPLGLLEESAEGDDGNGMVNHVTSELKRYSEMVDPETYNAVQPTSIWDETVQQVRNQGMKLLDIHRDMYLAAIEEGNTRKTEEAMRAHLTGEALTRAKAMTPEKMQRLSLFRVQKFYEMIDQAKADLNSWSWEGMKSTTASSTTSDGDNGGGGGGQSLPSDWEWTWPLQVNDAVEADLGGAFFPATITKVTGNSYDVKFFDGDVMNGLDRSMIKLTTPPSLSSSGGGNNSNGNDEQPPPGLTKKELKQWRRKQEKKKAKKGFS